MTGSLFGKNSEEHYTVLRRQKSNYRSSQKNLRDGELNPDLARDKRPFWPLNYHGRNKALTMGVEPIIFWLEVRRVAITPRELLFVEGFMK